jgi:hypothetical protein
MCQIESLGDWGGNTMKFEADRADPGGSRRPCCMIPMGKPARDRGTLPTHLARFMPRLSA